MLFNSKLTRKFKELYLLVLSLFEPSGLFEVVIYLLDFHRTHEARSKFLHDAIPTSQAEQIMHQHCLH